MRTLFILIVTAGLKALCYYTPQPVFYVLCVWCLIVLCGNIIRMTYNLFGGKKPWQWLQDAWAIFQTFTFITFTRLFFRSGSNLDPAEANETAWNKAALPHLVCQDAHPADDCGLRPHRIHHLPVHHGRPTIVHLFPVLISISYFCGKLLHGNI